MTMDQTDFLRLENKVDNLTEAVKSLVIVEERQVNQKVAIDTLSTRMSAAEELVRKADKRIDKWINICLGGWAVILVLFEMYKLMKG
jgi:hypothetical protein